MTQTKARAREEEAIHAAIVEYLRTMLPAAWLVHHSPNGGARVAERVRAAKMGTIAGWPDLEVKGRIYEDGKPEGYPFNVYFEVKAPRGTLSDEQIAVHDRLRDIGDRVFVVRSIDEVRRVAWDIGLPVRDATLDADAREGRLTRRRAA